MNMAAQSSKDSTIALALDADAICLLNPIISWPFGLSASDSLVPEAHLS